MKLEICLPDQILDGKTQVFGDGPVGHHEAALGVLDEQIVRYGVDQGAKQKALGVSIASRP